MPDPVISIVVVTYQHVEFIGKCLDAILDQDIEEPFEVLIGEDHSTDGTRELCEQYAANHPERIRLFLNDGKGKISIEGAPTGRRNILDLLAKAKGKYVAFCEGDDFWQSRDKLRKQYQLLESEPNSSGSYHHTMVVNTHGVEVRPFREILPVEMTFLSVIKELAPFHFSSLMFRRTLDPTRHVAYEKVGPFDFLLVAELAKHGKLLKVEGVSSGYRKHEGGVTETPLHKDMTFQLHRMLLWTHLFHSADEDRSFLRKEIIARYRSLCSLALGKRMNLRWLGKYYIRTLGIGARPDLATFRGLVKVCLD